MHHLKFPSSPICYKMTNIASIEFDIELKKINEGMGQVIELSIDGKSCGKYDNEKEARLGAGNICEGNI